MSYSICGFIIPLSEARICSTQKWPCVTLARDLSLIPLQRDFLFLTEGDATPAGDLRDFPIPAWFSEAAFCFSRCAYIEAEFWGGTGMQAAVVLERTRLIFGPEISPGAINTALRHMGVDDGLSVTLYGIASPTGEDPFDAVGLNRHRSVSAWLRESTL